MKRLDDSPMSDTLPDTSSHTDLLLPPIPASKRALYGSFKGSPDGDAFLNKRQKTAEVTDEEKPLLE